MRQGRETGSLMNNDPPRAAAFWRATLGLLHKYAGAPLPGGPPLMTSIAVRQELPPDLIRALGEPRIVPSLEAIFAQLDET